MADVLGYADAPEYQETPEAEISAGVDSFRVGEEETGEEGKSTEAVQGYEKGKG